MKRKIFAITMMALAVFIVAACAPATTEVEPETIVVEEPTEAVAIAPTQAEVAEEPPTPAPVPTDTAQPAPTEEPEVVEETADEGPDDPDEAIAAESAPVQFGRTEEGAFFYGSPTASITLIDHSDFL